ncbi:hypothetical protein FIA58_017365 [Flavobacterium jejuense]|uniref:Cell wall anchor protein n=1 Tax=Flavobacterium jejuense TaxID=1544455 RepID=A0ABX0IUG6_9FLAO|nr:hypothetical protein [Flavobacterium jejuense]NHN27452.1 hypothetical protein [Flavobacterium jejuense]
MKKELFKFELCYLVIVLFFSTQNSTAQIGINTTSPDASSALDITSTTQGILAPRMTTAQKLAITSPANGLLVYDTDFKEYSYYDLPATTWVNIKQGRSKFKRVKSTDVLATVLASELAAGGGSKYLLDTGTLYEINGTVLVDLPIELNNAYLVGLDAGEDKLVKSTGDLFTGTTGGTIKVLTLVASSGNVFNINGGGTQNFIFRDAIIASSANVGVLQNFALVFGSIIQFAGNTNGIIYRDISKLLLDNQAWFGNNTGTFEKFEGTFSSIQKQGGFCDVNGAAIGVDVSSNPTISVSGDLEGVNFSGTLSTGFYVKRYTVGSYTGYNFNNTWDVNCTGIPFEGDSFTVGDVSFDYGVGTGFLTTLTTSTPIKILGATSSNNFFRASNGSADNRIQYLGSKKRFFTVNAAASFQATSSSNTIYVFYIAKNGTVINRSKTYIYTTNTNDIFAFPLQTVVEMSPNDYVEVYVERYSGTSNMLTVSLSLYLR